MCRNSEKFPFQKHEIYALTSAQFINVLDILVIPLQGLERKVYKLGGEGIR